MSSQDVPRLTPSISCRPEAYELDERLTNIADANPDVVRTITDYLSTARVPAREYEREEPTYGYPANETGYVR